MRNKALSLVLITSISLLTLTACGSGDGSTLSGMSKSELITAYQQLSSQYSSLSTELENVQASYQSLSADGTATEAITTTGDGTGRFTFNSTDSKIIFPNSFVYPNSTTIVPDGKINITSSVSIAPSSSWISRINGSALEIEQSTNGISGTIKINAVEEEVDVDSLQEDVLEEWFDNDIAYSNVVYSNVFINEDACGKQAETPILIDSENAYLICGMVAYDNYSVTYIFVYRGNQDATKTELIKNLINTISIDGSYLLVQN
jgi:hypothetical protein